MHAIHHRIGINASPATIYTALTTDEGLTHWWTDDVSGAGEAGSTIQFRFNGGGPDFTVTELVPNRTVRWRHAGTVPTGWVGTEILFQLHVEGGQTFVRFSHSHWQESGDFMAHCSTKWAVFLLSLKDAIETGQGRPFPHDIQIDHS